MASSEDYLDIRPFKAAVSDEALADLKHLLRTARVGPPTLENTTDADPSLGVSRSWVQNAREYWLTKYDWYVNLYQYLIAQVTDRAATGARPSDA